MAEIKRTGSNRQTITRGMGGTAKLTPLSGRLDVNATDDVSVANLVGNPASATGTALSAAYVAWGPAPGGVNDLATVQAAIDALPSGGTLILRAGTYIFPTGGISIAKPMTLVGQGSVTSSVAGRTVLRCDSTTANLINITSAGLGARVERMMLRNSNGVGTPPTAGAGIASAASFVRFDDLCISGFFVGLDVTAGSTWNLNDSLFLSPVKYALKVANSAIADSGDPSVIGCTFSASVYDSDAAIRQESGGGLKITNCKINAGSGAGAGPKFGYGVDLALDGSTSDLLISNTSIENCRLGGVIARQSGASTATFFNIVLTGVQIALYQADLAVNYVDITPANGSRPFANITVSGCAFLAPVGQTGAGIRLSNVSDAEVGDGNVYLNFPVGGEVVVANAAAHVRTRQPSEFWISASQFAAGFGTPSLGAQRRWPVWLMDAAASELITATLTLMPPWLGFDVLLYWTNAGAGAGDVVWREDSEMKGDGDTLTDAGGASSGANVTATAPLVDVVKVTTLATFRSVTAGKPLNMRIWRQAANAADTLANDASILGVLIRKAN